MTRELDPSASVLAFFGSELRRSRLAAGLSQDKLGQECYVSGSLVRMIESAQRMPGRDFARRADETLGSDGTLSRMWPLVSREAYPTWFRPVAEVEREATTLREFECLVVPGLLQTEDYARAVLRAGRPDYTDEQVEEFVAARMERQAILSRPDPPLLVAVLDESVLARRVGSDAIMREQLERLVEVAQRPKIVLQVVPLSTGAHVGVVGPFVIFSFGDGHSMVSLEAAGTGQLIDQAEEVAASLVTYDVLRGEALPRDASIDLIRKAQGEVTR